VGTHPLKVNKASKTPERVVGTPRSKSANTDNNAPKASKATNSPSVPDAAARAKGEDSTKSAGTTKASSRDTRTTTPKVTSDESRPNTIGPKKRLHPKFMNTQPTGCRQQCGPQGVVKTLDRHGASDKGQSAMLAQAPRIAKRDEGTV
jgi:hypothetical protein